MAEKIDIFCPNCGNFTSITEVGGSPVYICPYDGWTKPVSEPIPIQTYRGTKHQAGVSITEKLSRMVRLTWDKTMALSSDVKCKKCGTFAVYATFEEVDKYVYGCTTCHTSWVD